MYDVSRALDTDYYLLFSELTDSERAAWGRAREFVDTEVLPVINDYWERADYPAELLKRLGQLDLTGELIDHPGMPALSATASGLVAMELNRGDGSIATLHGVQASLTMRCIGWLGSQEQKDTWLQPLSRFDKLGAFALTEPLHGSDSVALETSARRDGDGWILNGAKRWIGNGSIADVVVVLARNEEGKVNGFLVDPSTPGYSATTIPGKGVLRAIWQADVEFVDVRVPESNRLPGCNSFADVNTVLSASRAGIAWAALGHATFAYEAALSYSLQRDQFGKKLASFQMAQDTLVSMLAELTSMQLYCLRIGRLHEQGRLTGTMAALAKVHCSTKARYIVAQARDLMGGNGVLLENHVIRHMSDVEALHTFEGTANVQKLLVGRDITGIGAFS